MSENAVWPLHSVSRDGVRIEVRAQPAANLALVHNRVPLITALTITNESEIPLCGLRASIRLVGTDADLAEEWTRTLSADLPSGATAAWSDLGDVVPAIDHLADLNESHPGAIHVAVSAAGRESFVHRIPIQILAHNEWFNAPVFYDSLAAFVQPNTRAVRTVLDRAAELLRAQTASSSLDAYQQGPERASLIAAAVYESLRTRQIRYISPPASFENTGQKVRTTGQVLDERFGTCIDLAVTYAACIEQTGLHPLIWLSDGHAFTGFMLNEESLKHTSLTETNTMVNLFESHRAIAVEAMFYEQGPQGSFRNAVDTARGHFANPAGLRALIDISTARRDGIKPLPTPAEQVAEPTEAQTVTSHAVLDLPPELRRHTPGDAVLDSRDNAPARVKKWKRALLDLSTRNRLLNLRPSAQVIDLVVPNQGLSVLDDLIHNGKRIALAAHNDLSSIYQLQGVRTAQDVDPATLLDILTRESTAFAAVGEDAYARRLKGLQRAARTLLEETGAANLYLTFGSLVHTTSTGAQARAPLFLLPVQLVGGAGNSSFQIVADTANVATANHCLIEWLRIKHNVTIPALLNPPLDDAGIDIESAFIAIRSALVENRLTFRIDETAVLAICQFGTFGMWKDLTDSWDVLAQSPLVSHLTFRPGESFVDAATGTELGAVTVDETADPPPIQADGSQLRAVELSAQGRTFVLEGPPGTGKSQTITNVIARNLAAGRSVLFVAEKQAALEVVKGRLDRIGLRPFTLDLHGRNQSAVEVRNQLRDSIEYGIDYNERVWDARIAEYRAKHLPLAEYPARVHARNALGESLWDAYDTMLSLGTGADAQIGDVHAATTTPEQFTAIRDAIRLFSRTVRPGDLRPDNPWVLVGDPADDDTVRRAVRALDAAFAALCANATARAILTKLGSPGDVSPLLDRAADELKGAPIPAAQWQRYASGEWERQVSAVLAQTAQLQATWVNLTTVFNPAFLARGDYGALIQQANEATHGLFGRKRREELFGQNLRGVVLPGVTLTAGEAILLLTSVPSARDHSAHVYAQLRHALGAVAPQFWDPLAANAVAELQPALDYVRGSLEFARRHPAQWDILRTGMPIDEPTIATLGQVIAAWAGWGRALGATDMTVARWQGEATWLDAWRRDHGTWPADIEQHGPDLVRRVAKGAAALEPLRRPGLDGFVAQLLDGSIPASEAEFAYLRGAAQASLKERVRTQRFDGFDPLVRSGQTSDFAEVAERLRGEQTGALPARIMRHRPYAAGGLKGKMGELRRQLDVKRSGKTVRRLMQDYGQEILSTTPCFFVSPASLAQFVPPGSLTFDLVVFDEASQITVAQAIGALGRGRAAIVVGDSQQMPPTAFGQVTTNRDDEDDDGEDEVVPEDLDSILTECVESSVPRLWLSWHYRSRDEALIAFSNEKYYEGKLASLPAPGGLSSTGLELRRVAGHFNREDRKQDFRTNRVEAEAIVAEIGVRVSSGQSIGVVTFNRQQQELILDLLEATGDQRILHLLKPDTDGGIFVKNLENVQGDERDVILFSTAFSKRPGGQDMPLNFGPLTRFGGEKRLNVAVTRARSKVIVFTSFSPSDIDLSRTRSTGMAHLKAYLEAAAATSGAVASSGPQRRQPDRVQEEIAGALRATGLEVELDYGLSEFVVDVAVRAAGALRWQVAVMLDGPRWSRRATVNDRELTPGLLESMMGWPSCERVWLPEWIKDPAAVVERIVAAVEEAPLATLDAPVVAPPPVAVRESVAEVVEAPVKQLASVIVPPKQVITRGIASPYIAGPTDPIGSREDLDSPSRHEVRTRLRDAVWESIEIEGPIALNRLARNVVRRFGFDRVAGKRQDIVRRLVPEDLVFSDEFGTFVWPRDLDRHQWRGFRTTPSGFVRPLDEIAGEELINALVYAARNGVYDEEQLMRDTLALFDQKRLTAPAEARCQRCMAKAERLGRLVRKDGGLWGATS